ncbi:protein FAM76A isoform X1 [Odontomachus brunneus]|uniref:protein FAM76A isoform X1 n=1 Tax=Odontomachus brunneus TaxID=486640 RepID=UPI0013F2ABB7|nr:protein FAM76A isoform X1 [Odontomachus brunneus]XP_032677085.1 protein FAM76A isoform X1 [Odontomachus brunneus]XP_032677086.1 protein FAM76A isoform X1 [Odontomachus brunneus]XP_032677088.1 protein FAM76A isoform X1 [Odontomachus brunneus]XP_032677089.1 protein FAM76A isoform X1 [Odontomachus brunneus]XP_032677090.1 protein FAM76A isoform X1 [Odontomachus brunneus]
MSANNMQALSACSRCFSRHPFEDLSPGQQLCKECRGAFPVVKCTYCRSEFQQTVKGNTSTICKKCEQNVKSYGKPSACEYCNTIAAFIGSKCQRCTNSEKRYGPPVTCEQCKQKCAFDRQDEDKKLKRAQRNNNEEFLQCITQVDGKLLCWLCTLSYKRALAKTKQSDADRRAHMKLAQQRAAKHKEQKLKGHNKRPHRVDVTKLPPQSEGGDTNGPSPVKAARMAGVHDPHDPNSSDHVVAVTQLKEKIAHLQKQITIKDGQLLAKDRQITELKAKNFTSETELRNKMKASEKGYETKISNMQHKISSLLKEVASLSKTSKRGDRVAATKTEAGTNSGSGTDSPVP